MPTILIVKTSAIGDVIQTLPVLEYLLYKFPDAQIDWVVESTIAPLLRQLIFPSCSRVPLDRVLVTHTKQWAKAPFSRQTRQEVKQFCQELKQKNYDLLFDLQGNTKSAVITQVAQAKEKIGFGWRSVRERTNVLATSKRFDPPLDLNIRLKYLSLLQSYFDDKAPFVSQGLTFRLLDEEKVRLEQVLNLASLQRRPLFMVSVGSKWKNKRLDDAILLDFLNKVTAGIDPSYLFIYGSSEEKKTADRLAEAFAGRSEAVGELSFALWQSLMWKVDGVIAVDSAALHLAGTTQTPTFSVFGPTLATIFKPVEARHHAYQGLCPYGHSFVKQCPILRTCATGACIRKLNPNDLFQSFQRWYNLISSVSLELD